MWQRKVRYVLCFFSIWGQRLYRPTSSEWSPDLIDFSKGEEEEFPLEQGEKSVERLENLLNEEIT